MSEDFSERLSRLDTSLFRIAPTQSTEGDRRAWLAVQRSIRANGYSYLEIGSYLGGSIQQHLADPLCRHIISIDKRPLSPPDERDEIIQYHASTKQMMDYLRKVDPTAVSKITTFESDACSLDITQIPERPKLCFIDGEHTNEAVISDFEFCLRVCDADAAICFHDGRIIHPGLVKILRSLAERNIPFTARRLEGDTLGVFLRHCPSASDQHILQNSSDPAAFFRTMKLRSFAKRIVPRWAHSSFKAIFPAP